MKWWQQLLIQAGLVLLQGVVTQYLPADLVKVVTPAISIVQAGIAHKASISDPNTGVNIK